MEPHTRAEVTKLLKQIGQRIATAEALTSSDDPAAAMRTLLAARHLGGRATAVLLADCLQQALQGVRSPDRRMREASVDEFIRLADFAETTLCRTCRRRVASRVRRGLDG